MLPNLFWAMLVVGLVVHYLLRFTRSGRYMYATGSNCRSGAPPGHQPTRITIVAYVLSSGLAALGGILLVSRLSDRFAVDGQCL